MVATILMSTLLQILFVSVYMHAHKKFWIVDCGFEAQLYCACCLCAALYSLSLYSVESFSCPIAGQLIEA